MVFVYATEPGCEDVYSSVVTVKVYSDILITNLSPSGSICESGTWNLNVTATGAPNLIYQWQDSTLLGTWQNVSEAGGTTAGFTSDPLTQTTYYRVFVCAVEPGCDDVYSEVVTVTVFDDIAITAVSDGGSICEGGTWPLYVTATGSPNLLYQWQDSTSLGTWQNVSEAGGTTSGFISGPLSQTTYYRVFVYAIENGCEDLYSSVVTVNVFDDIAITAQPVGESICEGGTWNLNVAAKGLPNILYQWQDSTSLGIWQNVSEVGGTTAGFTSDPLSETTYYRVFVSATEPGCEDIYSAVVAVNVFDDIAITSVSEGGSICEGGTWNLNVIATGSPNLLYQWQDSTLLGTWQNVSEAGGTTAGFTSDPLSQTTYYRVFVYAIENGCEDLYSSVVVVNVFDDIAITAQPVGGSICEGGTWNLNVGATGSPNSLYQWQDSTSLGIWQNVSEVGGTTAGFTSDPLSETTYYRVFVSATEPGCEDIYSAVVAVNVFDDIAITSVSEGGSICEGGTWNLNVIATGSPNLLYQWQDSTVLGTWQNVSEVGGTTAGFTSDPLSQTTYYRVFVYATENGCEDLYSSVVVVNVFDDIAITAVSDGGSICVGGTWSLNVTATGSPNILYQWEDSTSIGT